MGEHMTCALATLLAGTFGGFFFFIGLENAVSLPINLLIAVLIAAIVCVFLFALIGLSRVEKILPSFLQLGLILGALTGLITAIGISVLHNVIPWIVIAPVIGFLVGYLLCWLCSLEQFACRKSRLGTK